jgi:hypothetical protein
MDWLSEEVGGFEDCAREGGELGRSGQDDAESFFRRTAIGRLAFASTIKGLRPAENILFSQIAGS